MITRETIYAALFAKVRGAADFTSASRHYGRHIVSSAELPSLVMQQMGEVPDRPRLGASVVWTLQVSLRIAACSTDVYVEPTTVLNPLVDAVEAALAPLSSSGVQDLGLPELVQNTHISGRVVFETNDNQVTAIIPVEVLCI